MIAQIKLFFREHPTMLLTFCYFVITVLGVLYSYYYYKEFGINIIKFADLSDFLLASVLEPQTLILFLGVIMLTIVNILLEAFLKKRFKSYSKFSTDMLKAKYTEPVAYILVITIITATMTSALASKNADKIKSGNFDEYQVRIADPGTLIADQSLALLGSTSRYIYFYHIKNSEALVIPVENVSFMRKTIIIKPSKQKDSANKKTSAEIKPKIKDEK
ncbi:MAG: hypothetical protein ACI9IA_001624 [Enterobacterales bacterium]|jgi:hypothetical protein